MYHDHNILSIFSTNRSSVKQAATWRIVLTCATNNANWDAASITIGTYDLESGA